MTSDWVSFVTRNWMSAPVQARRPLRNPILSLKRFKQTSTMLRAPCHDDIERMHGNGEPRRPFAGDIA